MSDEFLPIPVDPEQRVTELWAWISVHTNGGEGIVSAYFPRAGGNLMLVTSKERTAHMLQPMAERAAQSPDCDRLELRRFVLAK